MAAFASALDREYNRAKRGHATAQARFRRARQAHDAAPTASTLAAVKAADEELHGRARRLNDYAARYRKLGMAPPS